MGSSSTPEEFSDTDALQEALRAEHAAVYGYGYIGAHSTGAGRERSYTSLDAHRAQRDTLRDELVERNATPVAGASAYELPDRDDAELTAFAAQLEEQAEQTYLQLAASADPWLRDLAARSLQEAVVRRLTWGGSVTAFPGFPDGEGPQAGKSETD
ncbi:ferritin-like domain-containing protein [Nocardiopsis sediminis]|uniref:Ferritin-like domain-containing protein n=1 Tax=Nocardiopsis sediminis TaxID=1778267 RepID=A0ABV8FVT4_9ACTN